MLHIFLLFRGLTSGAIPLPIADRAGVDERAFQSGQIGRKDCSATLARGHADVSQRRASELAGTSALDQSFVGGSIGFHR
jgi:hypothetical protein